MEKFKIIWLLCSNSCRQNGFGPPINADKIYMHNYFRKNAHRGRQLTVGHVPLERAYIIIRLHLMGGTSMYVYPLQVQFPALTDWVVSLIKALLDRSLACLHVMQNFRAHRSRLRGSLCFHGMNNSRFRQFLDTYWVTNQRRADRSETQSPLTTEGLRKFNPVRAFSIRYFPASSYITGTP